MTETADYQYHLPSGFIAQEPAIPRDSSRLLIYLTQEDTILFDHFYNLHRYLPFNSFLVLNNTKVLPSRIVLKKQSGGKVKVLFLVNEECGDGLCRILVDRKVIVGENLYFQNGEYVSVASQNESIFTARFDFPKHHLFDLLNKAGTMPIPPYIKHSPLTNEELKKSYQTVFAKTPGSSAAPTASLHFTDSVFTRLKSHNIPHVYTTLHVGMGTFAPVTKKNVQEKKLHEEWYEISEESFRELEKYKKKGKKLVAVGTTVVRTLESLARRGTMREGFYKTDLFIFPPFQFRMVEHMVTNFHLPGSSLMMLVEAFLQYKRAHKKLTDIYSIAIREKFRFFSFGDAMLII